MDPETSNDQGISETVNSVDSINGRASENSRNSVDQAVSEAVIVIRSDDEDATRVRGENENLNGKANFKGLSKVGEDELKIKGVKDEKHSCAIDVKSDGGDGSRFAESLDGEMVCRICHLSFDQSPDGTTTSTTTKTMDLIQLGCGCKDELGIAHSHCAEAWFKLKGNRLCEICGETAKNVTGVGDNRFMEEWNERRSTSSGTNLSERRGGCWRGQPFCNFLMACLAYTRAKFVGSLRYEGFKLESCFLVQRHQVGCC